MVAFGMMARQQVEVADLVGVPPPPVFFLLNGSFVVKNEKHYSTYIWR